MFGLRALSPASTHAPPRVLELRNSKSAEEVGRIAFGRGTSKVRRSTPRPARSIGAIVLRAKAFATSLVGMRQSSCSEKCASSLQIVLSFSFAIHDTRKTYNFFVSYTSVENNKSVRVLVYVRSVRATTFLNVTAFTTLRLISPRMACALDG